MALLERVATLIRANVNELIEKAEQPETMIRQIVLDMENQLIQVKTQVAISIADQHALEKRVAEARESVAQWRKRAEAAIGKGDDALARSAAARLISARAMEESFEQQVEDQKIQVENLKAALASLREKLRQTEAARDMLLAQRRRSRGLEAVAGQPNGADLGRIRKKIEAEAAAAGGIGAMPTSVDEQFAAMENASEIDKLLAGIKADLAARSKSR